MSVPHIYAKRVARIAGAVIAMAIVAVGLLTALASRDEGLAAKAWLAGLAAGAAAYVLAYAIARIRVEVAVSQAYGDAVTRRTPPRLGAAFAARRLAEEYERVSLIVPFVAVALLGPLTLHALLYFGGSLRNFGAPKLFENFGGWIAISMFFVGHAHLVAAWFAARTAIRIVKLDRAELRDGGRAESASILVWSVVASVLPGGLLIVPVFVTAITGSVLLVVYELARGGFFREREAIDAATHAAAENELEALRALAENEAEDDAARAHALSGLARFSAANVAPILDRCLRSKSMRVRDRALAMCFEMHHQPDLELLLALVPATVEQAAAPLAHLISRHREDSRVEPALLRLLARSDREVKIAATRGLARAGTIRAVEPLAVIARARFGGTVSSEASVAIRAIQERLHPGKGRGQLAIAPARESGALSVPEDAGALSFSRPADRV